MALITPKKLPSQEYLLRRLAYEPESGLLRWRARPLEDFGGDRARWSGWTKRCAGKVAGHVAKVGKGDQVASIVSIDSIQYYQPRIIYKMLNGCDPPCDIDHKDRDRLTNLPTNLRAATRQQNTWNRKVRADSSWGLKGVTFKKRKGRFEAGIFVDGKRKYLGLFATAEEAHQAYCDAAKIAYGEFWSDGK